MQIVPQHQDGGRGSPLGTMACIQCGQSFPRRQGRGSPSRYCSDACRYAARYTPVVSIKRRCVICDVEFGCSVGSPKQVCSSKCSTINRSPKGVMRCDRCGTEYSGRDSKYCSTECGRQSSQRRRKVETCRNCGCSFMPKSIDRVTFHSRQCAFAYRTRNAKGKKITERLPLAELLRRKFSRMTRRSATMRYGLGYGNTASLKFYRCQECNILRMHSSSGKKRRCDKCALLARRDQNKIAKRRREMRVRVNYIEYVNIRRLVTRQNGQCAICHRPMTGAVPEPRAATVDHIHPISKGGEHSYQNTQAACFMCNSIKGDSLPSTGGHVFSSIFCPKADP